MESDGITIECESCGKYWIAKIAVDQCKTKYTDELWKLAAIINEKNNQGLEVALFSQQNLIPTNAPTGSIGILEALALFPKSLAERLDRILLNLERKTTHLGDQILIEQGSEPLMMAYNVQEMMFLLRHLIDAGYLSGYNSGIPCRITLSTKALERVADLQRGLWGPLSKQAFIAMSFDRDLDQAWTEGLKLAVEDCSYKPLRVDAKEHNEKICDVIVAEIRKSKFLVADFTQHRGGVYFEAGLMMGLGRPVIFTCRENEIGKAHFDTRQYSHIIWNTPGDLREKLKRRIQATITP